MSFTRMSALTRGPLPARVYWMRRLLVFGTVFVLVLGIARILTGGSDASSREEPRAVQVAATPAASGPTAIAPTPSKTRKQKKPQERRTKKELVLAHPEGPCADGDVAVKPTVENPVAGRTVFMVLELRTVTSAACTWRVSPDTLAVKVTSGRDEIWSSQQCPRAVPTRSVVIRSAVSTKVGIRWSGRRSDDGCTRLTQWALPGWYHVAAAALAGEPADLQFELQRPTREVITRTPDAEQDKNRGGIKNKSKDKNDQLKHR